MNIICIRHNDKLCKLIPISANIVHIHGLCNS